MISKKILKFWARQIEVFHIIIFVLGIIAVIMLIVSKNIIRIVSASYLLILYLIQKAYGLCPLTKLENILIELTGEGIKGKKFIPRFFKKYLPVKFTDNAVEWIMLILSIISVWILISYFFL